MTQTRICNICGTEKPLTREFYGHNGYKNSAGVNPFRRSCRACLNAKRRARREANIDQFRADELVRAKKYQSGKAGFVPSWNLINTLWGEQTGCCYLCCNPLDRNDINVDHKTPVSQGGSNRKTNLGLTCSNCNKEKHGKTVAQYRAWQFGSA